MQITTITDASARGGAGVKDEEVDPEKLLESLTALNAIQNGLNRIQLQQLRDRHRLDLHSAANENNYKEVLSGSIFETAVFIAVAVFQVTVLCQQTWCLLDADCMCNVLCA